MNAIVIFAKYPEPGTVKKRIGRVVGMETSAELCKAILQDIIQQTGDRDYDLYLSFIGREHKEQYRNLFPSAILYVQRGTNLEQNVKYMFQDLLDDHEKVILVSGDAPLITHDLIQRAFNALDFYDVVIGPAEDGGYYLIGMKHYRDVFTGLPFGTDSLIASQKDMLKDKKLTFVTLEVLPDIDTMDELEQMKKSLKRERAPHTFDVLSKI
jgi:rSAM/selenodomain-associated transferase 1